MNLWRITQHSPNGASTGVEDFRVWQGPLGPSMLVEKGNYLQVVDMIMDMGSQGLKFGAGAVESQFDGLLAKVKGFD